MHAFRGAQRFVSPVSWLVLRSRIFKAVSLLSSAGIAPSERKTSTASKANGLDMTFINHFLIELRPILWHVQGCLGYILSRPSLHPRFKASQWGIQTTMFRPIAEYGICRAYSIPCSAIHGLVTLDVFIFCILDLRKKIRVCTPAQTYTRGAS